MCAALTALFGSEALLCQQELPVAGVWGQPEGSRRAGGRDGDRGDASDIGSDAPACREPFTLPYAH